MVNEGRYWGFVPAQNVIGKAVPVWWSCEAGGTNLTDLVNVHHIIDKATHFYTKTR